MAVERKQPNNGPDRGHKSRRVKSVLAATALLLVSLSLDAPAHPDVEVRIMAVSEQIKAHPDDASPLLARGELHAEDKDWIAALRDFELGANEDDDNDGLSDY